MLCKSPSSAGNGAAHLDIQATQLAVLLHLLPWTMQSLVTLKGEQGAMPTRTMEYLLANEQDWGF